LISTSGKNQYLLVSAGEAAAIDVSEAHDEVGSILDGMGIGLKYLLITHGHKFHLQALGDLKKNTAAHSACMSMNMKFIRNQRLPWSPTVS
jgi:glyoxylase-like metal-dependent hydrolase (beta-lactamase superfamily II)